MKIPRIRSFIFATALLALPAALLSAGEPTKEEAAIAAKLITSVAESDYQSFTADWDVAVKPKLRKEPFSTTCAQYAGRFAAGYEVTFLGDLRQVGCRVTLWKVSFKDLGDDALVTLVAKEGKVAGFWIK